MRFGILYEINTPRPWHDRSDYDRYWECIDEIKLAEAVGFDEVWAVEHHFTEQFAHCSAPEVFLAAVAQHTSTMRLGHGVVLLPKPYNHVVRVAERAAALDILSHGRLDVGTGRSSTALEMKGFGVDPDETRPMWEEAIRLLPKLWTEERFGFEGKYYQLPKRTVLPRPFQKPHPPLWTAGAQMSTVEMAAHLGIGLLNMVLLDPEQAFEFIECYRRGIKNAEPVAGLVTNQFGAFTLGYCSEDEEEVQKVAAPGALFYATERSRVDAAWERSLGYIPDSFRYSSETRPAIDFDSPNALAELATLGTMAVGTPDQCRVVVDNFDKAGADQLLLYMELPYMNHEQIAKSVKTFGEKVIQPYKAARGLGTLRSESLESEPATISGG